MVRTQGDPRLGFDRGRRRPTGMNVRTEPLPCTPVPIRELNDARCRNSLSSRRLRKTAPPTIPTRDLRGGRTAHSRRTPVGARNGLGIATVQGDPVQIASRL